MRLLGTAGSHLQLEAVDALILEEFRAALGIESPPTIERKSGPAPYASRRRTGPVVLIDARRLACALQS